jgi:hypothetical protein
VGKDVSSLVVGHAAAEDVVPMAANVVAALAPVDVQADAVGDIDTVAHNVLVGAVVEDDFVVIDQDVGDFAVDVVVVHDVVTVDKLLDVVVRNVVDIPVAGCSGVGYVGLVDTAAVELAVARAADYLTA